MAVARWWFDANIPFNAARSRYNHPMIDAITTIGPGFKTPNYHELRGVLLKIVCMRFMIIFLISRTCGRLTNAPSWLMGGQIKGKNQ